MSKLIVLFSDAEVNHLLEVCTTEVSSVKDITLSEVLKQSIKPRILKVCIINVALPQR